jgi:hypothetical protein
MGDVPTELLPDGDLGAIFGDYLDEEFGDDLFAGLGDGGADPAIKYVSN